MVGALMQFPVIMLLALGAGATERPAALPAGDDPLFRGHPMDEPRAVPEPAVRPARRAPGVTLLPRLSSRFGYRRDPFHGGLKMHDGIDIPGPLGSPIRAADAGVVRFAGKAGGYGNMMEIMHAGDLETRYGHLSRMLVPAGATVRRGDIIALMGSTGRSTGSHLHFEVRAHGRIVDPLREFGPTPAPAGAPQGVRPPYLSAFARVRLETADAPGIR
jgi:murein DD-endopeptidase MepM/ murein hydrolase activator NlpD